MSFIVPQEIAADGAPDSGNKLVEKEKMAAGSYATYRFSGSRDKDRYAAAQSKLLSWLRQQNRTPRGVAIIASYDPPYTPSFLRRNEILIPLQ